MPGSQDNLSTSVPAPTLPAAPSIVDAFLDNMPPEMREQYETNKRSNDKLEGLFRAYDQLILATSKQASSAFVLKGNTGLFTALEQMLKHFLAQSNPTEADKAVAGAFTAYMTNLATLDSDQYDPFNGLADTLEGIDKNAVTKQIKKPMHPVLKAIIAGIIGAVVGAVICAAVGVGVTWYAAGVGAIPGFFVGLVKGFMVGSTVAMGTTATMGGVGLLSAGLFGYINHAERKAIDAKNAQNIMSADIRADVEAMKERLPSKKA